MRYFTVPKTISLQDPFLKQPLPPEQEVSFRRYAYQCWLNSPTIVGAARVKRWGDKVVPHFDVDVSGVIALEDADWTELCSVIESAQAAYSPLIEYQLLAYRDVVLQASQVPPGSELVAEPVP